MATESQAYIERLDYLRNEVKKAIQGMSTEELNWAPRDKDTNSACVLVTHIAGTEGFWIHQMVGGTDVDRNRDTEFAARASNVAELKALLDSTAQTTRNILQNLSSDDLGQTKEPRSGAEPVSLRYGILHTIEHLGQHLGHLTLTKQIYAARSGNT